ncbi:MAG: phage baseplate assembly protein V [Bacteroidota bacterium]
MFSPEGGDSEPSSRTLYARLSTFVAGGLASAVFRPEVNDEVVIGFISGDPRFPLVLGALHNKDALPAWPLQEKEGKLQQLQRGIRVQKPGGEWKILFDEEADKLEVSSQEFKIALEDGNQKLTLSDQADKNQIVFSQSGILIQSDKAITLQIKEGNKLGSTVTLDKNLKLATDKGNVVMEGKEIVQKAKTGLSSKATTIKFN